MNMRVWLIFGLAGLLVAGIGKTVAAQTVQAYQQLSPAYAFNAPGYVGAGATPLATPEAGLTAQFIGTENLTYDTNPLLITNGAKTLFGSTTAPELLLTEVDPMSKFSLDTVVDENVYNHSEFDSTDLHEIINAGHQNDQWATSLKATGDYDTTRTSEITTFGINLPRVRHTGFSGTPEVSYSPTVVDKLTLAGSAQTSHYDNSAFIDYNLYTINPSYEHNFDPLNAGILTIQAQRYEATSGTRQTRDTIGPSLGWLAALTPRLNLLMTGGFEKTSENGYSTQSQSTGLDYVFSSNLRFNGQEDTTTLIVSRQQSPFANGTEALLTSLSLAENHALNMRFSLIGNIAYESADYPNSTGINLASQLTAGAGVLYHASEHLDVSANYQYKSEKLTSISNTITDNSVILSLIYRPMGAAL